ncbi:MAG: hypothetical protein R3F49_12775 [Planctomycetota bacterium]
MNVIRTLLSLLIICLVVISLLGIAWWQDPPAKLASYATGGQFALGALTIAGLAGVWQLWAPVER